MKKLLFALALLFAFTFSVNAQDKKFSVEDEANKEASMLAEVVGLNKSQTEDFYRLFEMKYKTLQDENLSIERKQEFLRIVMLKVQATLNAEQMTRLEKKHRFIRQNKNGCKI